MDRIRLNDFDILTSRGIESILIVIVTILVLFWLRPKPHKVRREKHDSISVEIISDESSCNEIINKLLKNKKDKSFLMGFDCEWTPSLHQFNNKNYKIGLLQLATHSNIILIRLNKMSYKIPKSLQLLLQNNNILKCGVGIHQDITKLYRDFDIKTVGVIELNDIYKLSSYYDEIVDTKSKSLKALYQKICNKTMKYKEKSVTLSHWNSFDELSMEQIHYAADDALVGYKVFRKLMNDIFGIIDSSEYVIECKDYIDLQDVKKKKEKTPADIEAAKRQKIANKLKEERKQKMRDNSKQTVKYSILKPDGSVLFYCGKFRFEWFVYNKLAQTVDETRCKLIFNGYNEEQKIEKQQDNICFVCGIAGNDDQKIEINRFNILDDCYWKLLKNEEIQQKALIGNMIPLCFIKTDFVKSCIFKAKQSKIDFMRQFYQKYTNITKHPLTMKTDAEWKKAKSSSNALNKSHSTIPIKRKIELIKNVANYFGLIYDDEIKEDEEKQYDEFLNITGCNKNDNNTLYDKNMSSSDIFRKCMFELLQDEKEQIRLHSEELLQEIKCNETEFVEMWRKNFIDTMRPQFIPSYWPFKRLQK